MFQRLRNRIEKKRAESFVANVNAWYQACSAIYEMMGDALNDQTVIQADIGYIIDTADRLLFHMRSYIPNSVFN